MLDYYTYESRFTLYFLLRCSLRHMCLRHASSFTPCMLATLLFRRGCATPVFAAVTAAMPLLLQSVLPLPTDAHYDDEDVFTFASATPPPAPLCCYDDAAAA